MIRLKWNRVLLSAGLGLHMAGATPAADRSVAMDGQVIVESDLVYGTAVDYTGSNVVLTLDAYYKNSAETNRPVVIFVHGGGFGGGDKGYTIWQGNFYPDMATAFASNGYAAFSINYRLWPNSGEDFPLELEMAVEDVMTAVDWIREHQDLYGADASKVLIAGDSAGGGLAVNASYRTNNAASFLGCISLWGGLPPYNGTVHAVNTCPINDQTPPTCLIHGTADPGVPYAISENLSSNLTAASIYNELHALEGYSHYPVMVNGVYNSNLVGSIIQYMIRFAEQTTDDLKTERSIKIDNLLVSDDLFRFEISSSTTMTVEIAQTTNLMSPWQIIATNQLFGESVPFTNSASAERQFYRVRIIDP